jgi:tetratricopeptide (TPR) repeat protein
LLAAFELDRRLASYAEDLVRLSRASGEWKELLATLERAASGPGPDAERIELYLELGARHEELGADAQALEAYRAALKLDAADAAVLDRLEHVYRRTSSVELLDVLQKRIDATLDRDEQVRLLEGLADAAARMGRWVRAVKARLRCAESEARSEQRGHQLYEAGVIYRDQLASFEEAFDCFDRANDCYTEAGVTTPAELSEAHRGLIAKRRTQAQR